MNISTNRTMSVICWPLIKVCQWMGQHAPVTLVKLRYWGKFRRLPNLDNPQDLNEKILWQKLYADISTWAILADKYRVRKHMIDFGLEKYLVTLYGKWNHENDIEFDKLPNEVIFKANNGDGKGTNMIVRDLHNADKEKLKKIFHKWLNDKNLGDLSAEPHYKLMPPCIIAEEVLRLPAGCKSLIDYKIWCINGVPLYIWTCSNRDDDGGGADVMTYDIEWNPHPEFSIFTHEYRHGNLLPKPENLSEMIALAEKLSTGIPILRVDLYNIDGVIYFGELTFTSQGGMMDFYTEKFLMELGQKADISYLKIIRNC